MSAAHLEEERAKRLIAMGEMAASLAHEIRNPLGSMELFCSLLEKDLRDQPPLRQLAEQIHKGIRTLDQIIHNCLQFARGVVPNRRLVPDIREFLEDVVSHARAKAESFHVPVSIQIRGDGGASFDPYQIQQALLNLILNGIDAVSDVSERKPEHGVTVFADLTEPKRITFCVADRGSGISPETMTQIFDPFFTTKSEGTGLGLAVVHSIISAHGGSIALESPAGEGTRAVIQLPREENE